MLSKGPKWLLKGENHLAYNVSSLLSQALLPPCLFDKVLLAGAPPLMRARPWAETGSRVLRDKKPFSPKQPSLPEDLSGSLAAPLLSNPLSVWDGGGPTSSHIKSSLLVPSHRMTG